MPQVKQREFRNRKTKRIDKRESFDSMLRRFRKKCERAGIVAECRKREFYEKPAEKRQRKINEAKRRAAKARRAEQAPLRRRH